MSSGAEQQLSEASPSHDDVFTFLFTDIEGSTQRWEAAPAEMRGALQRHDARLRAVFETHHGHVFKTVGDAFCVAFQSPSAAIAAALDGQRVLNQEDWSAIGGLSVRMALHTGMAERREGDYFGRAVNRVARLLSIGYGGQVLVSSVTHDLLQRSLPPKANLRLIGEHRLRDLTNLETVYQLEAPGIRERFPPLRSVTELANNLPMLATSFVGREVEIEQIRTLLTNNRLVTLIGSGGVGKTRTSLQVAAHLLDGFRDGVWFIELAPLASGIYVGSSIASAMGLSPAPDGDPLDTLVHALKAKSALLVLDNCEHLVDSVARTLAAILRGCSGMKILASSRQMIGIRGEIVYRMPSLDAPLMSECISASLARSFPAVALFVDRARSVDNRFELVDENATLVAEICQRLDGIPLAIELAAVRVKSLSLRQLKERLDQRFRVLTSGNRDVPPRQQTLRALIDWSHDLLDEREQILFRRLSIFAGTFSIEAASAVGGGNDFDESDVLDLLSSLVDKSLIIGEPYDGDLRYRFLESTRAYALEKLSEPGVTSEAFAVAHRHAAYFLDFARRADDSYWTLNESVWRGSISPERDNFRLALEWCLRQRNDVLLGAGLVGFLAWPFYALSLNAESLAWCDMALKALDQERYLELAAGVHFHIGTLFKYVGLERARASAHLAVDLYRKVGSLPQLAASLLVYSTIVGVADPDGARLAGELAEEAHELGRQLGRDRLRALALRNKSLSMDPIDIHGRRSLLLESRNLFRSVGADRDSANILSWIAEDEFAAGDLLQARVWARESLRELEIVGAKFIIADTLNSVAIYELAADDITAAREAGREALLIATELQNLEQRYLAMMVLGYVAVKTDRGMIGASLVGHVWKCWSEKTFLKESPSVYLRDKLFEMLNREFADALPILLSEGGRLSDSQAMDIALSV